MEISESKYLPPLQHCMAPQPAERYDFGSPSVVASASQPFFSGPFSFSASLNFLSMKKKQITKLIGFQNTISHCDNEWQFIGNVKRDGRTVCGTVVKVMRCVCQVTVHII